MINLGKNCCHCFPVFLLRLMYEAVFVLCSSPIYSANSFEHDFVEDESGTDQKELSAKHSDTIFANAERRSTVWNAKVHYYPHSLSLLAHKNKGNICVLCIGFCKLKTLYKMD